VLESRKRIDQKTLSFQERKRQSESDYIETDQKISPVQITNSFDWGGIRVSSVAAAQEQGVLCIRKKRQRQREHSPDYDEAGRN